MIIKNAKLENYKELQDIIIINGVITDIKEKGCFDVTTNNKEEIIDAKGNLVIPPFVEPHIHLDAVLTAGEPHYNLSGTLFEGIQRWAERKDLLSEEDVIERAVKAVKMCAVHGIQYMRTHVDVTDPSLIALKALLKVKEQVKDYMELQIVAFPQEGIISYENGKELMEKAVDMGVDVVGAIPHYEFTREDGIESLKYAMKLAKDNNLLVDIHCDEIDDEQSRFVETVAAEAIKLGLYNKVTASHTCAMGSYNDAYAYKLFNILKKSKINFACCAVENIHLQGRMDTYPKRRGITRVKELDKAGMNVCFGEDSIQDPWYPFGDGNILNVLFQCLHITQLMGYDEIKDAIRFIAYNGAKAMHIEDKYGIEKGKDGNFLILDAYSEYEALRKRADVLYSINKGRVIAATKPKESVIFGEKYV